MVKRIIGSIFAIVVVVVIVFTAIGAGSYESMLGDNWFGGDKSDVVEPSQAVEQVVEVADTLANEVVGELAGEAESASEEAEGVE